LLGSWFSFNREHETRLVRRRVLLPHMITTIPPPTCLPPGHGGTRPNSYHTGVRLGPTSDYYTAGREPPQAISYPSPMLDSKTEGSDQISNLVGFHCIQGTHPLRCDQSVMLTSKRRGRNFHRALNHSDFAAPTALPDESG